MQLSGRYLEMISTGGRLSIVTDGYHGACIKSLNDNDFGLYFRVVQFLATANSSRLPPLGDIPKQQTL